MTNEVDALKRQLAELQQRNARLEKINQALMQRVESGPESTDGAYDNFKHSVYLAEQVRERTEALNEVMHNLKSTNSELVTANEAATHAHDLLRQAIESISDAFVLYDADRKLVLANSRFNQFWESSGIAISQGMDQQRIHRLAQKYRLIDRYYGDVPSNSNPATSPAREAYRALPGDGKIFHMRSGAWVHVSERPTKDGGLVVLYKDISVLIENERALREEALAKKSRTLQNTLDNLSQGVVLVNKNRQLETWNRRFAELTGLEQTALESGATFCNIMSLTEVSDLNPWSRDEWGRQTLQREQVLSDGRVFEIKTHPMPGGEFVNTYTDITERSHAVKALAESEQRVRVITDTVPALIGYVDKDMKMTFSNRAYEEWYGYDRKVILGRKLHEFIQPEQLKRLQPYIDRALSGRSVTFEITDPSASGELRHVVKNYVPEFDEYGSVQGLYVLIQDITEIRRTSEALAQAYQHLEQRVEDRTKELRELNDQLLQEIDVRSQIENRLREAKLEAEKANHSKTKFLAAASHDLLQPMNAARLFCASLLEHSLDDRTRQLVNSLSYSLEDVETLLAALVDISKLDAGVVKPDITAFSAGDLLGNLANEYHTLAADSGLQFEYLATSAVIMSDSQLLARILRNFLTNAVRYTRSGKITLGCRRRKDGLEIQVWDTGVGIAEDKLEEIFLEFNRGSQKDTAKDKGLGLGLAIVDKMSGILKTRIQVHSQLDRGSCFSVLVPYGRKQQVRRPAAPDFLITGNQQFLGRRALVLDNEASICQAMEVLLGSWGFDVLAVQSYEELLLCREELEDGIDLILADYHLDNGETGIDAVALMRSELGLDAPVLMITANYTNSLKQEVREQGYRLMNKPVRPAKLKAMIHHMLQQHVIA
ncbi:NahK/ErcS family hybrid sensor histidine kinase/response regulator [Oceanobacter kriegii]|uniref:NahK/ErcS family hybrid sensor histidine kinase/response regulator n=1 Tax=Oceanobacter kriegii TaxID=64972 RepID=UPI000422A154|nr:NahK/ErcS family hybrid sensor histidine kinase/response regulator [Oceanobacter kriegii]